MSNIKEYQDRFESAIDFIRSLTADDKFMSNPIYAHGAKQIVNGYDKMMKENSFSKKDKNIKITKEVRQNIEFMCEIAIDGSDPGLCKAVVISCANQIDEHLDIIDKELDNAIKLLERVMSPDLYNNKDRTLGPDIEAFLNKCNKKENK